MYTNLREIVEETIEEIKKDYEKNEKKYTTEGDIVCNLFAKLSEKLSEILKQEELTLHSQVRPFRGEIGEEEVIVEGDSKSKDTKWEKQGEKANIGSVVDLAIIDMGNNFWDTICRKARKDQNRNNHRLNYWRMLSFPVEAFLVAIEVKVKVKGNKKRINKDINKLVEIKKANPNCLTYMIIFDREADSKKIKEIKDNEKRIDKIFTYPE